MEFASRQIIGSKVRRRWEKHSGKASRWFSTRSGLIVIKKLKAAAVQNMIKKIKRTGGRKSYMGFRHRSELVARCFNRYRIKLTMCRKFRTDSWPRYFLGFEEAKRYCFWGRGKGICIPPNMSLPGPGRRGVGGSLFDFWFEERRRGEKG